MPKARRIQGPPAANRSKPAGQQPVLVRAGAGFEEHDQRQLVQLGLICRCGERIRQDGIQVFWPVTTVVGHDRQLQRQMRSEVFHSPECPQFAPRAGEAVAIVKTPVVTWADERIVTPEPSHRLGGEPPPAGE